MLGVIFLLLTIGATQSSSLAYASSDAYDSGYDHGCNDAGISNPDDRYINQPEKGPAFHTGTFMHGYNDGFNACSGNNSFGNGGGSNEDERNDGNGIMYQDNGYVLSKYKRPPINPDFAPDYSCLFDTFQLKCIPGSEQECPEGFGTGDPETCFSKTFINGKWEWKCPKGYHNVDDDETGQCYPNEGGCEYDDMVLLTNRAGRSDRCASLDYICGENGEYPNHPKCKKFCDENPERNICKPDLNLN
jgi:hypothetical protein